MIAEDVVMNVELLVGYSLVTHGHNLASLQSRAPLSRAATASCPQVNALRLTTLLFFVEQVTTRAA